MSNTITATIRGQYQYPYMPKPKAFETTAKFTLIPPDPGEQHYGTGCYMSVEYGNGNDDYVDVRYARTTDIKKLAEAFIKDHWGENLREYEFA